MNNSAAVTFLLKCLAKAKVMTSRLRYEMAKSTERLKPYMQTRQYRGFVLHYSRGTSLIERTRLGQMYEDAMSRAIAAELSNSNKPAFIDIGANIGLITLNVLALAPSTRIYAFEPGPHQWSLLKKTVEANGLDSRIGLCNVALGREPGNAPFASHRPCDASGDGFIDTGRAGVVDYVTVPVQTLDNWWNSESRPHIDVVKIDTEGAELWVLEGAVEFLATCQPAIYLEIFPVNLHAYPYGAPDILDWLHAHNYAIATLDGIRMTSTNMDGLLVKPETFVAKPNGVALATAEVVWNSHATTIVHESVPGAGS